MNKVFIIAEAGVNHNGSLSIAKKMVDAAKNAGADAVKFQTFKAKNIATKLAPKAAYQKNTTNSNETQFDMLKSLELSIEAHKELMNYCKKKKIMFLSTPFDLESIVMLNKLGLEIFKIPSGEITNMPYLRKIGALKKKIIMSTGMSNIKEIKEALDILIKSGTQKKHIILLQCNTEYPTPYEHVNLRAMHTIKESFKVKVGYSDHTLGIEVPLAAVALGAVVIEKHFTLDKNMRGPDHKASLEPEELKYMVQAIRKVERAMGVTFKKPSPSELKNRDLMRKSITAARDIKKGEIFTVNNITIKRPNTGISPMKWDEVIGCLAKKDFATDEMIEL